MPLGTHRVRHRYMSDTFYFTKTLFPLTSICTALVCSIKRRTSSKFSCLRVSTEKRSSRTDEFSKNTFTLYQRANSFKMISNRSFSKRKYPCLRSYIDLPFYHSFSIKFLYHLLSRLQLDILISISNHNTSLYQRCRRR